MKIPKTLYDISWQVDEPTYRKDEALSYSTLSSYERNGGFNSLGTLFSHKGTPSLTFGSAVDALITGGEQEFNDNFFIADNKDTPSDKECQVIKELFENYKEQYNNIKLIPQDLIIEACNNNDYNKHWRDSTRANKISEVGESYYNLLYLSNGRQIISRDVYSDVMNAVETLRTSPSTKRYFMPNNPYDDIVRYYQLKFKATLNKVDYRCMADLLVVDYNNKEITPVDLKTSSKTEWDFYKSFIDWNYAIQARLYYRIIRSVMDSDPYFKDFTLNDYRFIVINKRTLTPLVWRFSSTKSYGTLKFGKNKQIECRDPEAIGEELHDYLQKHPRVPNNINIRGFNELDIWLNTL